MAHTDDFDPTRALDGWRPPAPVAVDLELGRLTRPEVVQGFDATHALDGWQPPAPAPLDLELRAPRRARSGMDEAKRARLKARGYEMLEVEDVELVEAPPKPRVVFVEARAEEMPPAPDEPAVDLPLADEEVWPLFTEEAQILEAAVEPAAKPAPEPVTVDAQARVAEPPIEPPVLDLRAFAPPAPRVVEDIELPPVPPSPVVCEAPELDFRAEPPRVAETPELDMTALAPRPPEPDPRLLARWQAGAWTALARRVAGASEELLQTPAGLRLESHAPQWLCAIWPAQAEDTPLARWPELASLVAAESRADALQQLIVELPDEAPLWSADLEADWDLVAELVLHQDGALRPAQVQALRQLAAAEREARLARMAAGYGLQGRVARRRA